MDTIINSDRFFLVAPNRFGQGYIKYISNGEVWSADLKKSNATKVASVKLVKKLTNEEIVQASLCHTQLDVLNERLNDPCLTRGELGEQIILEHKQSLLSWFSDHNILVQA